MGGTLHKIKSVIDALSLGLLNLGNSNSLLKDNVRNECYGYAFQCSSESACEGILYPHSTFLRRYVQHTGVGRHSTSRQAGFPRTEEAGE